MELILWADTHYFADHEIKKKIEEAPNTYLLGDIVDFKNCRKKDLDEAISYYDRLKFIFEDKMIDGNHEISKGDHYLTVETLEGKTVGFTHGHRIFWSTEKVIDWENRPVKGIGAFKEFKLTVAHELRTLFKTSKSLSKSNQNKCLEYMKNYNLDVLLLGHIHPKKLIDIEIEGKRVVVCERGRNTIIL